MMSHPVYCAYDGALDAIYPFSSLANFLDRKWRVLSVVNHLVL